MPVVYFPQEKLRQALSLTSKIKQRLEPFIEAVTNNNIEWTFFICSQLYQVLSNSDSQIMLRFNSLAALKLLLNTCEFPIILITEVYFLPIISKVASYQLHLNEKMRGLDYFSPNLSTKPQLAKKIGYNYIRLACEIISIFAVIKPFRVFKDKQLPQSSDFKIALQEMLNKKWEQYDKLAFFPNNPLQMRSNFLQKLQAFNKNICNYQIFIKICFDKIIRQDLYPTGLDIRKLLQFYQPFACNFVFQSLRQMIHEKQVVTLINLLKVLTDFVKWGNIQAYYIIQTDQILEEYYDRMIENNSSLISSDRYSIIFEQLQGSDEERRQLYRQLLCSLQIWTACIAQDLLDPRRESKTTFLYKRFRVEKKIQFPYVGNLKKIRNENAANLERYKLFNELSMNFSKQISYKSAFARRQSVQLKRLMSLDSQNMKQLFQQARSAKNKVNSSRQKYVEDDLSDIQNYSSKDKIIWSSSLGERRYQKTSTFPQNYFRQKKRNKKIQKTQGYMGGFNFNLTATSNSMNTDQDLNEVSQTFVIDTIKQNNNLLLRLKTVSSQDEFQKQESDFDSVIGRSFIQTDYSEQIQEGLNAKTVKIIQKFKNTNYLEKYDNSKRQNKQTIIQFFDQSKDWSVSTISSGKNSSMKSKSIQPKIVILQPTLKMDKQYNNKEKIEGSNHLNKRKIEVYDIDSRENQFQSSFDRYARLQEKVTYLEAQRIFLKKQLNEKNEEILCLKKSGIRNSLSSWSNFIISQSQINSGSPLNVKKNRISKPLYHTQYEVNEKIMKFQHELNDLKKFSPKKLLKKKDLLFKSIKIEIGYIFQNKQNYSELTIFVTPIKDMKNIKCSILFSESFISFMEQNDVGTKHIDKGQQKKIKYKIKVLKVPFSMPIFRIIYDMQDQKFNHQIQLPLSFNKFIQLEPSNIEIIKPFILHIQNGLLNKKVFKSTKQLYEYLSCLTYKCIGKGKEQVQLSGSFEIDGKKMSLNIRIKNEQDMQLSCKVSEQAKNLRQQAQFFMTTMFKIITR